MGAVPEGGGSTGAGSFGAEPEGGGGTGDNVELAEAIEEAYVEGFLEATGGGFAEPGTGGGARDIRKSGGAFVEDSDEECDTVDDGLLVGLGGGLRKFATMGLTDSVDGRGGGRTPGSLGGFDVDASCAPGKGTSESDTETESRMAPVSTPPRLRSFGIPPANRPPSCGAG